MPQPTATGSGDETAPGSPGAQTVLFSREEALGGMPGRRAQTLLFLIERRVSRLAAQWQTLAMLSAGPEAALTLPYVGDELLAGEPASHDDPASLDVFVLAREGSRRLTARHIERYAPDWAPLIPPQNPRLSAALAHLLAQKYRFTRDGTPTMRAALRLDTPEVQQAYQRLYHAPLDSIYVPPTTVADRVRWLTVTPGRWLQALPPFWLAFLLLLLLPLPQAALGLPIAAAEVGPLGGIIVLLVVGALNLLTVGYVAEAAARSSTSRTGAPSVGALAADLLGPVGATFLLVPMAVALAVGMLAGFVGLGSTLDHFTGVPSIIWMAILAVIAFAVLARPAWRPSTGALLALSGLGLVLLLVVAILGLTQMRSGNLTAGAAGSFGASSLGLIAGVAIMCFTGHLLVGPLAGVLPRDEGDGRAVIRGGIAGTACLLLVLIIWLVATGGAVPQSALLGQRSTAIVPLAKPVGLGVSVLGSLLVVLLLGRTVVQAALTLFDVAERRLPGTTRGIATLPARQGRLVAALPAVGPNARLGITYLGMEGNAPHIRLDLQAGGELHQTETTLPQRSDAATLLARLPDHGSNLAHGAGSRLSLETLATDEGSLRLRVEAPSRVRIGVDGAAVIGGDDQGAGREAARNRSLLAAGPLVAVFVLAVVLDLVTTPSFSGILAFAGIVAGAALAGVAPALLVLAARRKGDLPASGVLGALDRPAVAGVVGAIFLIVPLVWGIFVWDSPAERIVAIIAGLAAVAGVALLLRRGAMAPRLVVALRDDQRTNGRGTFSVLAGGEPVSAARVLLAYPDQERQSDAASGDLPAATTLRAATFSLPQTHARELKVWAQRIGADGDAAAMPARIEIRQGQQAWRLDGRLADGHVLPIAAAAIEVEILPGAAGPS